MYLLITYSKKLCQFMHLPYSRVLKSLSSINKQTISGYDFHKSDKHFTHERDNQGFLPIIPMNALLSRGLIGKV